MASTGSVVGSRPTHSGLNMAVGSAVTSSMKAVCSSATVACNYTRCWASSRVPRVGSARPAARVGDDDRGSREVDLSGGLVDGFSQGGGAVGCSQVDDVDAVPSGSQDLGEAVPT